ncbi:hypothetical protein CHARACLAT_033589 [Characodon lateralis]|uniref:Uncharacterized protein n=1 Tax=Characodon lateralis TaxID=208331 RepID=A0ABU7DEU5_9TELE|nr:hypothetical protein [Characodon lateralis]
MIKCSGAGTVTADLVIHRDNFIMQPKITADTPSWSPPGRCRPAGRRGEDVGLGSELMHDGRWSETGDVCSDLKENLGEGQRTHFQLHYFPAKTLMILTFLTKVFIFYPTKYKLFDISK